LLKLPVEHFVEPGMGGSFEVEYALDRSPQANRLKRLIAYSTIPPQNSHP
jgi:hypothetical protein